MQNLDIVYEDNHIIVVVKPPNILSQGDNTGDCSMVDIASNYIKHKYNKKGNVYLGLVHRLDRPVGGLMVLAKTSKAASRLSASLQKNEVKRSYIAVVEGNIRSQELINYIVQDNNGYMVNSTVYDPNAKKAVLNVMALESRQNTTLCKIDLKTGRKHQIRAQLSIAGHPLLYDMRYGNGVNGKQIALWGSWLSIVHPTTKKVLLFKSKPYTKSFEQYGDIIDELISYEEII